MCGIAGIINLKNQSLAQPNEWIASMLKAMQHRGPDGSGIYLNESQSVALGHVRLSIIDLSSNASQPMQSNDSTLSYNGELYNYLNLKSTISKKFNSTSDTEVLQYSLDSQLNTFAKFEIEKILNSFNGMFCFAYYHKQTDNTLIARDHSGEKQLYYTVYGDLFIFASEIKGIIALPFIQREIDKQALYNFLTFSYNHPPQTIFKNISKLPPAHFIKIEQGNVSIQKYWEVNYHNDFQNYSEVELIEKLQATTRKVIQDRLVSDVPIGLFLSGGVDSSALTHFARESYSGSISTFTAGFDSMHKYNELDIAETIAKKYNTHHTEILITKNDIQNHLTSIAETFDDALADAPSIPIYFIAQIARAQNIKVVLNGDGPDELLFGYTGNWPKYARYAKLFDWYKKLPQSVKKIVLNTLERDNEVSPFNELLQRAYNNTEFFWGGASTFKDATKNNFLTSNFLLQVDKNSSYSLIQSFKSSYEQASRFSNHHYADWMSYLGYKAIIPNYYTLRADRLGMAHGVEIRSPFLDKDFVSLALNIPFKYKYNNGISKHIFKKSLEPFLPHDILYRGKMGFNVPLREWIHDIIIKEVDNNLKSFCIHTDVFEYEKIRGAINELKRGNIHYTRQIWCVYFLMNWYKKYLNF